jgi:acyl CoA:acetate/3-ketoacid CoA transferase alpha subunit/acyl CoA:acetate/3-ketoacid CoA transferase beta subunit
VRRFIREGMALHTLVTHAFPYALINEVVRQFWRKDPKFTLLALGAVNQALVFLRGGMLERIVTSYCGDVYPAPGPNPNFNEAYLGGRVTIENWTVLTFSQRMLAGALGLSGMPTRSLSGSSMAEDNQDAYTRIPDPFGDGEAGFLKALRPDLSLVHGWVADPAGNVLFSPPLSENLWGALGARQGAVVSVEKIVDTDFIRQHAHLARLPAQYVRAVVELPFGAHPGGFFGRPIRDCKSYAEDYDFIVDFRNRNRDPETFDAWIREWILDCRNHQEYLKKLGPSRLADLIAQGRPDSWEDELALLSGEISDDPVAVPTEIMTVHAAHRLVDRCREKGYRAILAGQGTSNLAAWLANYLLERQQVEVDLVAETGFFGYAPRPGNPFLFNFANIPRCKMLTDSLMGLGAVVGGATSSCIGSLSAGQVDKHANINSTLIPGVYYIVGSGGACDVLSTADEVVLTAPLLPMRYVDQVPYVTGPGRRVSTVVCDRGVFEKPPGHEELVLTALVPEGDKSKQEVVEEIKGLLGWEPKVASELGWVDLPTPEELKSIRILDPRRAFLKLPKED